ncbi:MAG TPA: NAD(P)-dependent oxidoreductase [Bacteroidales bacterium]|nr:NAD(P)-dependent oxidoreductase [Bacteroidales bacterium]HRX96551.1 NAD(P)-dependent oxidoreductase [Bacteroidales bacterium]
MTKVLIATVKPFASNAVNGIREVCEKAGYEMALLEKYGSEDDLIKAVADADAVIIRSDNITKEVIDAGNNLKIIVRAGAGYDNVDLQAATAKGVVVMNTPGQNSNAVAELALGMMVYMARNGYNGSAGTELRGKKIGIHAFGHVGQLVGKIANGFGMKVYAFDPFIADEKIRDFGATPVNSAEELYKECQYISLHIPANEKTKGSINYALLSSMPEGATLVNTARKEVINEEDLKKVMRERGDFKYISDIAPDCAPEIESNFSGRFFFTPKKMGAQTAEANNNAGIAAAEQIVGFIEKNDTTFKVN